MVTHSSILAWEIPWREKPGGLQSMGSQSQAQLKQLSRHADAAYFSSFNRSSFFSLDLKSSSPCQFLLKLRCHF